MALAATAVAISVAFGFPCLRTIMAIKTAKFARKMTANSFLYVENAVSDVVIQMSTNNIIKQ